MRKRPAERWEEARGGDAGPGNKVSSSALCPAGRTQLRSSWDTPAPEPQQSGEHGAKNQEGASPAGRASDRQARVGTAVTPLISCVNCYDVSALNLSVSLFRMEVSVDYRLLARCKECVFYEASSTVLGWINFLLQNE